MDDVPAPLLIAHRLPDSAADCRALVEQGADGFELDIQLRGNAVVVSHYLPFLQIPGWLEHDGTRFRWGGGRIRDPELLNAAARTPAGARLVLDPKEQRTRRRHRLADAVAVLLREHPERFVVTADDERDLRTYRQAGITTWRTVGTPNGLNRVLRSTAGPDAGVAVRHTLLSPAVVERLRRRAATIAAWTVNDVDRARALVAMGVDAITTDNPAVLRAVRAS
jgi:glycerophosphoryl diester phosphodiesterase